MIRLTRDQVRRLRSVFRRWVLGITHRGPIPPLVLRAEGTHLRAQYRYHHLAVEHVEAGSYQPAMSIAIPLDALADFEGRDDSPVILEAPGPDRTVVRWEDRAIPQSREYDVTPIDRLGEMPQGPATWVSLSADLLRALAEATETGIPDSPRYALDCIQLQGARSQIVATDGHQLLVRTGFSFPWDGDLLVRGSPLFACKALPHDQPVEVARTDAHVVLRVGPWTICCAIQTDVRFPDVERVIPGDGEVATRLSLDPQDARFLGSALVRLPGSAENNRPVTVDLNGQVALRATASDQSQQVTELMLGRSSYTGSSLCIAINRDFLDRALRLGFTEIGFSGVESPFVCRDQRTVYAVQPLTGGSPIDPQASVTRIESNATAGGKSRGRPHSETPGSAMSESIRRNGHEPARPAETNGPVMVRPAATNGSHPTKSAGTNGTVGSETTGTSLAALIQEAESLHATLADTKSRAARLIAGLRRQRKQSRLLQETLKSLRQLRLVETAE
jgi:hypothetical protein